VVARSSDDAVRRGTIYWIDLAEPARSEPGFRRPAVIIQADDFNRSLIGTTVVALLASNLALADAPGNVTVHARESRLPRDSVINVSQLYTVDKTVLGELCARRSDQKMRAVDAGLRLALGLSP
jgi:mRNA interferase MazF